MKTVCYFPFFSQQQLTAKRLNATSSLLKKHATTIGLTRKITKKNLNIK